MTGFRIDVSLAAIPPTLAPASVSLLPPWILDGRVRLEIETTTATDTRVRGLFVGCFCCCFFLNYVRRTMTGSFGWPSLLIVLALHNVSSAAVGKFLKH